MDTVADMSWSQQVLSCWQVLQDPDPKLPANWEEPQQGARQCGPAHDKTPIKAQYMLAVV